MRCHETRAFGSAYRDSELDAKTSFEIEQHLGQCRACARHFEAERRVDERIVSALLPHSKDEILWSGIEARLTKVPVEKTLPERRSWKSAALAIAACLALAITWLAWPSSAPPNIVAAAAVDHAKFLAGNMPAQFAGEPPADILAKAKGRLDHNAFDLLPTTADFSSEGKRLCHLEGVPVAWMMGRADGQPVSVIAMRRDELASFPALKKRFEQGHRIACFKAGGFEFAARRVGEHVVCMIGDLPRPELEALLASVSPDL